MNCLIQQAAAIAFNKCFHTRAANRIYAEMMLNEQEKT